jgi:adenylate kinase family enzyme
VFFAQTAPLIDYYTKTGKLVEVNGEGGMDEIKQRILIAVGKKSTRRG